MKRVKSQRFIFDYEYYEADRTKERMLHIIIRGKSPIQVHLYLDEIDQEKLTKLLNEW